MRRIAMASLTVGTLASIAVACSSKGASSASASSEGDAALPLLSNQPLGAPCDPSLSNACAPGGNSCATVTCDESSRTCAELESDAPCGEDDGAGTLDAPIGAGCTSTASCASGQACAYLVTLGCAAQGVCVAPAPPAASAEGGVLAACGCDGAPVTYVTPLTTSAPASSPSPCVDVSTDGDGPD